MLVQSFLAWMETAPVRERAEAVTMLANAYLNGALGSDTPQVVEAALTSVLDDPAIMVRRALALAFADRNDAPRHIILSLAADQSEVAGLLVARSPLLTEADLIDLTVTGERMTMMAIALRQDVTARVAHAVLARKDFDSAFALVGNGLSMISEADLLAIAKAYGDQARMREALLARADLPATVRHALLMRVADRLGGFAAEGGFIQKQRQARLVSESVQSGTMQIAKGSGRNLPHFVAHLRETGQLTPSLVLRSVLGGDTAFLTVALADLCDMDVTRVARILGSGAEAASTALMRRAGLPDFLIPVLVAAVRAANVLPEGDKRSDFAMPVLRAAQEGCLQVDGEEGVKLLAMLRRQEAEAARTESRRIAEELKRQSALHIAEVTLVPVDVSAEDLRLDVMPADAVPLIEHAVPPEAEVENKERLVVRMDRIIARPPAPIDRPARPVLSPPQQAKPAALPASAREPRVPSLKALIAEWKAERAEIERAEAAKFAASFGNRNEKPGRSRVA